MSTANHKPCDTSRKCPHCAARWCLAYCDYSHLCGQDNLGPAYQTTHHDFPDLHIAITGPDLEIDGPEAFIAALDNRQLLADAEMHAKFTMCGDKALARAVNQQYRAWIVAGLTHQLAQQAGIDSLEGNP